MALLVMILRKMAKNLWLELSLLFGLILTVSLISSMPIYTNASLQRMLLKDLENVQVKTGKYPGLHYSTAFLPADISPEDAARQIREADDFILGNIQPHLGMPILAKAIERQTDMYYIVPEDTQRANPNKRRMITLGTISGLEETAELIDGRWPAKEVVDGVYEVVVEQDALFDLEMVIDTVFIIQDESTNNSIKVKPVGVIEPKGGNDLSWFSQSRANYNTTFFISFDLFERDFTSSKVLPVHASTWYTALDYSRITLDNADVFMNTLSRLDYFLFQRYPVYALEAPAAGTISQYYDREASLTKLLWSLNVPVMIMLGFYLFMVSNLITDKQKNEIAVLRSRGASRLQIVMSYVIEGLILGAIAFLVGPLIGALLTKVLGASNGFLEFVQRKSLRVAITPTAYKYAAVAVLGSLVMTLIPVFLATRLTIVGHKQQLARQQKTSFWHKYFLDILLIALSGYGLYNFERQRTELVSLGVDSSVLSVDPMLFVVPALFILGTGLLILRLYPLFVRLVYWLGQKWWPPALYSTLIQVGRSSTQYQFLMVFLIMTIATGLYGASAARTLNNNVEEKIRYANGADIVLNVRWESNRAYIEAAELVGDPSIMPYQRLQYTEPAFEPFAQLPGVEHAAKVYIKKDVQYEHGKNKGNLTLMGIHTKDFGQTAWIRDGLLGHHFYEYLNLIATEPTAVLITKTLADQTGAKPGDQISLGWPGIENRTFVIYGIVEYWPTFNPNPTQQTAAGRKPETPKMVIGHLDYIQNTMALEPYEIWIKLEEGASRQAFVDAIAEQKMPVISMKDTIQELTDAKNDPYQLAINGVMTLGFLISIMISFVGFLLYWIFNLHSRVLQFGIFRAMGIRFRQLVGMLTTEQLLTSGAAVVIGVVTGQLTSQLFVRLFQISFDPLTQVPPFRVVIDPSDSISLYIVVAIMLVLGLAILSFLLSRIKIHQAVKLGED